MTITVAEVNKTYKDGLTLSELIKIENVENPLYISVAVNDDFVRSGDFDTHILKDGDSVEFMYFMGGGC